MSRNNNSSNPSATTSSPSSSPVKNIINRIAPYSGMYLFGKVIDRTRRHVPKDNPTTEIVTYTVQTERDSKYFVDDYAPDSYYDIGSDVCFPVYIKTYKRRNGDPSYTLMIQQDDLSRGEHF